jgi:uncharacterized membrane protein YdbT with pleckstrin-like domain
MSYVDHNLLAGEKVVFRTHLHCKVFVGPALLILFILIPAAWYLSESAWHAYAWAPGLLGVLILLPPLIRRQSSDFAVTNKRVMMKVGVLNTRSIELLLGKVEAIAVNQTLLGRMLDYGDIVVTGSGGTRETFSSIQAPLEFRRAVQSVSDVERPAAS